MFSQRTPTHNRNHTYHNSRVSINTTTTQGHGIQAVDTKTPPSGGRSFCKLSSNYEVVLLYHANEFSHELLLQFDEYVHG